MGHIAQTAKPLDLGIGCSNFDIDRAVRQDFIDVTESGSYDQYTKGFVSVVTSGISLWMYMATLGILLYSDLQHVFLNITNFGISF